MKLTGIWIDTKEARIVELNGRRITSNVLYSGISKKPKLEGETSKRKQQGMIGFDYESKQKARYREELKKYLRSVADTVAGSSGYYLMGPADVKKMLEKEMLATSNIHGVIHTVENCGRITDNQLVDKVTTFFNVNKRRESSKQYTKR